MDTATGPIVTTTLLSALLHGAVVAGLLAVNSQVSPELAVGQGLEIELISSVTVAEQNETELPDLLRRGQLHELTQQEIRQQIVDDTGAQIVTALNSKNRVVVIESMDKKFIEPLSEKYEPEKSNSEIFNSEKSEPEVKQQSISENDSNESVMQSTNASQQRHSILELLHSSISDKKSYPYLARRQRREGTTTVAFVLHPDGTIENAQLINSSRTIALDRAALSAVKDIEPFEVAQKYLEKAEEFRVDVVFNLL